MEAFSIAGTSKLPSWDGIQLGAMEWTAKNKRREQDSSCQISYMVNMKIVTFPVTAFTTNSNISSGIPGLFPLLMSGHTLSWEGKHILASSVDRPLKRGQDFMHKEESSREWASPEPAGIILSSETYIPSKHCRQISPSASAVGWIICMINCRWPSVAFICTILRSVMSTIWYV